MNAPGETRTPPTPTPTPQSLLDKPLGELTENDIAQLTREDCRQYLKNKGMRRPSWNKSQAIQQVVSLKALLEARPDNEFDDNQPAPQVAVPLTSWGGRGAAAAAALTPYRRRDRVPPLATAADASAAEIGCSPSPSRSGPSSQLTIFYGGNVNVYDDVPAEKARTIMQLAASPGFDDGPVGVLQSSRSLPCRFGPGAGPTDATAAGRLQNWRTSLETDPEGPTSREVSLQRYLVKRKDRFKGKAVVGAPSPSNREIMCHSKKYSTHSMNEQSSRGNTSSPTQPRPPSTPTRCSSMENKASKLRISIDLNEEGEDN